MQQTLLHAYYVRALISEIQTLPLLPLKSAPLPSAFLKISEDQIRLLCMVA